MIKKGLQLVLSVSNKMGRGMKGAHKSLQKFGKSALNIGKFFLKSFAAAGAAVAGFAAKALSAYAKQEAAEREMAGAFRAYGEEVDANTERVKKFAAAIQDETGVADENLIARAAKLRMLGVETDALEEATKATVALAAVGMKEEQAIRAVAQARQGNYSALTRYLPELRAANTEEEKAAILQDFLARGYEHQKDQLNTLTGQWGQLKSRLGDVWEEVGRGIASNDMLTKAIERAADWVKRFGERVTEFVDSGGFVNIHSIALHVFEDIRHRITMVVKNWNVMTGAIRDNKVFQYVATVAAAGFQRIVAEIKFMGQYALAVFNRIRRPFSKFEPPDMSEVRAAIDNFHDAVRGRHLEDTNHHGDALRAREAEEIRHHQRMYDLQEQQHDALNKMREDSNNRHIASLAEVGDEYEDLIQPMIDGNESVADSVEDIADAHAHAQQAADMHAMSEVRAANTSEREHRRAADSIRGAYDDLYDGLDDRNERAVRGAESLRDAYTGATEAASGLNERDVIGGSFVGATGSASGRGDVQLQGGLPPSRLGFRESVLDGRGSGGFQDNRNINEMVSILKGIRSDNKKLLRWG